MHAVQTTVDPVVIQKALLLLLLGGVAEVEAAARIPLATGERRAGSEEGADELVGRALSSRRTVYEPSCRRCTLYVRLRVSVAHGRKSQPWSVVVTMNVSFPPFALGACLFAEPGFANAKAASARAPATRTGSAIRRYMCSPFAWSTNPFALKAARIMRASHFSSF